MSDIDSPKEAPSPIARLPFASEAGDRLNTDPAVSVSLPDRPPTFRITQKRIIDHGETSGCHGCEQSRENASCTTPHSRACRERFLKLLSGKGELANRSVPAAEPATDYSAINFLLQSAGDEPVPPDDVGAAHLEELLAEERASNLLAKDSEDVDAMLATLATEIADEDESSARAEAARAVAASLHTARQASQEAPPTKEEARQVLFDNFNELTGCTVPPVLTTEPGQRKIGRAMTLDMSDYCSDTVALYKRVTGVTQLKNATTPFCPDGSLVAADDCIKERYMPKYHQGQAPGCDAIDAHDAHG